MVSVEALTSVLGCSPDQPHIRTLLDQINSLGTSCLDPEIKAYPDVVYHNYQALGLSLQCEYKEHSTMRVCNDRKLTCLTQPLQAHR